MSLATLKTSMQNYFTAIKNQLDVHTHDDRYYTKTEVDDKIETVTVQLRKPTADTLEINYNGDWYQIWKRPV